MAPFAPLCIACLCLRRPDDERPRKGHLRMAHHRSRRSLRDLCSVMADPSRTGYRTPSPASCQLPAETPSQRNQASKPRGTPPPSGAGAPQRSTFRNLPGCQTKNPMWPRVCHMPPPGMSDRLGALWIFSSMGVKPEIFSLQLFQKTSQRPSKAGFSQKKGPTGPRPIIVQGFQSLRVFTRTVLHQRASVPDKRTTRHDS